MKTIHRRFPISTRRQVDQAWKHIHLDFIAARYTVAQRRQIKRSLRRRALKFGMDLSP